MACTECLGTPVCLEAYVNPCSTGTYIGLVATETGTWTMRLEFNGVWKYFGVEVVEGEEIAILTSLLNEKYVHQLKVYNTANELVDCYKLKTHISFNSTNAPVPPVADGAWDWETVIVTTDTMTVTSDYFTGDLSPEIWIDGNPVNVSMNGITGTGTGTLNFTTYGGIYGAGTPVRIDFQYRNLNP